MPQMRPRMDETVQISHADSHIEQQQFVRQLMERQFVLVQFRRIMGWRFYLRRRSGKQMVIDN